MKKSLFVLCLKGFCCFFLLSSPFFCALPNLITTFVFELFLNFNTIFLYNICAGLLVALYLHRQFLQNVFC